MRENVGQKSFKNASCRVQIHAIIGIYLSFNQKVCIAVNLDEIKAIIMLNFFVFVEVSFVLSLGTRALGQFCFRFYFANYLLREQLRLRNKNIIKIYSYNCINLPLLLSKNRCFSRQKQRKYSGKSVSKWVRVLSSRQPILSPHFTAFGLTITKAVVI